jgi:hypothetical protein
MMARSDLPAAACRDRALICYLSFCIQHAKETAFIAQIHPDSCAERLLSNVFSLTRPPELSNLLPRSHPILTATRKGLVWDAMPAVSIGLSEFAGFPLSTIRNSILSSKRISERTFTIQDRQVFGSR